MPRCRSLALVKCSECAGRQGVGGLLFARLRSRVEHLEYSSRLCGLESSSEYARSTVQNGGLSSRQTCITRARRPLTRWFICEMRREPGSLGRHARPSLYAPCNISALAVNGRPGSRVTWRMQNSILKNAICWGNGFASLSRDPGAWFAGTVHAGSFLCPIPVDCRIGEDVAHAEPWECCLPQ